MQTLLDLAHRGKLGNQGIDWRNNSVCEGLGSETGPGIRELYKIQSKWRTSMIEVRSAKKKEGKTSGTNPVKPCESTFSLSIF